MRRGFALIEILILIIVIPFVLVIIDGLFRTLLTDIPWSCRIVQENTTVLNMLEQLHQDIDKARGLPKSFAGRTASDELLLIEAADGVICYQIENGQAARLMLTGAQYNNAVQKRVWPVPSAEVKWTVWDRNGKGYAVEIRTHIERETPRRTEKKLANSRVYFLGALQEDTNSR